MQNLTITYRAVLDLSENPRNARTHDQRQIHQIKNSIETFGFTNPLLIDETGKLIAGHGRLLAAKDLGHDEVPVIVLSHLTNAQQRALMLADNKIALNAGWDMKLLASELDDLSSMELSFDAEVTGFEVGEIDIIVDGGAEKSPDEAEVAPLPDSDAPVISRYGDLWHLGPHRVSCGDARTPEDLDFLMSGRTADMVFTDPPYNVRIAGHVSGNGKVRHREFHEASGEMTESGFTAFLNETLANAASACRDGAVAFVCMDWRHICELHEAGHAAFGDLINLCVWAKTNAGMGSLYRSQHELVFVFRKGCLTSALMVPNRTIC